MKIIIVESRKINHTPFKSLDTQWNFFCCMADQEMAEQYIKSTTTIGAVWYQYLEFRFSEQEVYGL